MLLTFVWLGVGACTQQKAEEPEKAVSLESFDAKLTYVFGMDVGRSLRQTEIKPDFEVLLQAIKSGYNGEKLLMTDEQMNKVKEEYSRNLTEKYQKEKSEETARNKAEGAKFLAENKDKEGVVTTPSGLQYQVLVAGDGASPKVEDKVTVHYRGTLIDGKEFDSSYSRGEPAVLPLNQMIPGWIEVLPLMKVGSKYRVFIPSELAYGDREAGPDIGPGTTLIFEIELLAIGDK